MYKFYKGVFFMNKISENAVESLTVLYLQNQDLSGKSPEDLYRMYVETYRKFTELNAGNPENQATAKIVNPANILNRR